MTATDNTIVEEREELMVSFTGDSKPILRKAHFLIPSVTSINESHLPLDTDSPCLLPPRVFKPSKWPLKIEFSAWRSPTKGWKTWVFRMQSMHQSAWKKAGIHDAIMSSVYQICRDDDLLFGLAEKWCSNTNTFIFPWGEATITLEDVMVLGGYSVLGRPVSCSVQNREWKRIEGKLMEARVQVGRSKARKACQSGWMKKFIEGGSEIEHEAFLSLWLSRFVFQTPALVIRKEVFPMAILLARGIPLALAPAVLASIYRDLTHLKREIVALSKFHSIGEYEDNRLLLCFRSPFQLVQLWALERFPALQPNPSLFSPGDPRSARWEKERVRKIENVRLALDSAGESFLWRPYTKFVHNWHFPKFYKEKEELVLLDSGLDEELESFARCLRVSKLVGIECMEHYFPHRVAMQFGMDQDLPGCVLKLAGTSQVAWKHYSEPINDSRLYIPSRLFESDVTIRYLKWWNQFVLGQQEAMEEPVEQQTSLDQSKKDSKETQEDRDPDVPPGFLAKCKTEKIENSVEGDKQAVVGMLCTCDKLSGQGQDSLAPSAHDGAVMKMGSMSSMPLAENILNGLVTMGESERSKEGESERMEGNMVYDRVSIKGSGITQWHPEFLEEKNGNRVPDVPPGFPPNNTGKGGNAFEGDKTLNARNKDETSSYRSIGKDGRLSGQSQSSLASFTDDRDVGKMGSMTELTENILHDNVGIGRTGNLIYNRGSILGSEGESNSHALEIPWMTLEARIRRLERETAQMKAARFGHSLQQNYKERWHGPN